VSKKPVLFFVALVALAACSGQSGGPSSPPATVAVTPEVTQAPTPVATVKPAATAASPVTFTSPLYGYTITLPPDWAVGAAILRWDGRSAPGHEEPTVDKFGGPPSASAWANAAPVTVDLDRFVKDNIAWTVRDHGDTCPATAPEKTEPIKIGGETGTLLSWDCGILINQALLVRNGTGYVFVMRDLAVQAATDPADRALLESLLNAVTFPS